VAELGGQGIARWWSRRFSQSVRARALVAEPQELPSEEIKATSSLHELGVGDENLPGLRAA
jgi:hypothetical protein